MSKTTDNPINLDTDLTKLRSRRARKKVAADDFTRICPDCGRRTHYSSDWCHASSGCLARYWRMVERMHIENAREAGKIAAGLEAEAAKEREN